MARLVSKHAQRSLLRGQSRRFSLSVRCRVSDPLLRLSTLDSYGSTVQLSWIVLLVVHLALRSPGSDHAVSTGVTVEIAVICGSLLTRLDPVDPEM